MKRMFVEFPGFAKLVRSGQISDRMIKALQTDIMAGQGDVIKGTGGLKKVRFGMEASGKRGGLRAVFADYPQFGVTVLLDAFAKNKQAGLRPSEVNEFRKFKAQLDEAVEAEYG